MDHLPCSAIASHSESFLSRGSNDSKPSSRSRSLNGLVKTVTAPLPAACIAHEVNQPLMAETTDASACIGWLAAATSPIVTRTTCANCTAAHQRVLRGRTSLSGATRQFVFLPFAFCLCTEAFFSNLLA